MSKLLDGRGRPWAAVEADLTRARIALPQDRSAARSVGGAIGPSSGMLSCVLLDLTHPVRSGMPVYPGDPQVSTVAALTVAEHGVNVLRVQLGSHSGTHVDAPFHVRDDLPRLDELPLEQFTGRAVLVDARGLAPRAPIGPEHLEPVRARLAPGVHVLVVTGWSRHWESDHYLAHPWLSTEFAQQLLGAGVRTLALDSLSADRTPPPGGLPAHLALAQAGCVIAENLTGLEPLLQAQAAGADIEVSLLPLHLADADGAPIRAVARVRP